jgi:hypothetical protein
MWKRRVRTRHWWLRLTRSAPHARVVVANRWSVTSSVWNNSNPSPPEQHGVRQAFAIQAGREVRVIVDAKKVDDARASKIAHDIAKRIEDEMTYPGEVRVTVLREIRAVGIAR